MVRYTVVAEEAVEEVIRLLEQEGKVLSVLLTLHSTLVQLLLMVRQYAQVKLLMPLVIQQMLTHLPVVSVR